MLPLQSPDLDLRIKKKYKYNQCCVPTCEKHYPPLQNKRFYRLPKDAGRRQQWIEILGITLAKVNTRSSLSVCGDHFGEEAFTSTLRQRLNIFAKPLVPASLVSNNVEVATSNQSVPNEFTKTCVEESESVHTDLTSEKINDTIDVDGTAISLPKDNKLQRKTISEDKNKKVTYENKVYVYELPSGRKVMYYHLPILENFK